MDKIDLTRQYRSYYTATTAPALVTLADQAVYAAIGGAGEPGGDAFTGAVSALYPVAYAVKAASKQQGRDFGVPKLEGLWWVVDERPALDVPRDEWHWQLLIRLPDFIDEAALAAARQTVAEKKRIAAARGVELLRLAEGECAQVLHVGPYADEAATVATLHGFIGSAGLKPRGLHHEIYLSDPAKTAPEKMRTILRQPVDRID